MKNQAFFVWLATSLHYKSGSVQTSLSVYITSSVKQNYQVLFVYLSDLGQIMSFLALLYL